MSTIKRLHRQAKSRRQRLAFTLLELIVVLTGVAYVTTCTVAPTSNPVCRVAATAPRQTVSTMDTADSSERCPIGRDWVTDFDHADPDYNTHAPEIWQSLRAGGCPVAHTQSYGGAWLPVTEEAVRQIAYDTENFSSVGVVVSNIKPDWEHMGLGAAAPITSDPPFHHHARRILLPAFSPHKIAGLEDDVRGLCSDLLDNIEDQLASADSREFDAAELYTQHIPVHVIARMLGMPIEHADLFRQFVHVVLEQVDVSADERDQLVDQVVNYIRNVVDDHRANRREDLVSHLIDSVDADGQPLGDEHIVGTVLLLLVAGIDTTWSAIGSTIMHFGRAAQDRERLLVEPELLTGAIEEMLRAYAPVTMARIVKDDVEVSGVQMRRGDWTLLPFPAANRDPDQFDRADEVLIDRVENRHAAFGLGIHRCIGSNLARLEMRVALEEFLKRFPRYEVSGDVRWSVGQVRGPRQLPVRLL